MTYIATLKEEVMAKDSYELFEEVTAKDINDKDVQIKKSVGTFTINELESQKATWQKRITDADAKIASINLLSK